MVARLDLAEKTLDELAEWKAKVDAGSPYNHLADTEFLRRQTALQIETTSAAKDTADSTRRAARYMLASVIVLAVSATITAGITGLQWFEAYQQLTLTMKPSVDFDTEEDGDNPPVGVAIQNSGPGPAIIKSITYYVDRKPVGGAAAARAKGKLDNKQTEHIDFDPDDTLAVGPKAWLFRHQKRGDEDTKELDRFVDFVGSHLGIEVEFCSVHGECWTKCSTKGSCSP